MLNSNVSKDCQRVLLYARYSTDKQNDRSIEAQLGMLRDWLAKNGWRNCQITEVSDRGISGAELKRPGIDRVKDLIEAKQVDIVIAEDIARFYRDEIFFGVFVKQATDYSVQVMTVNDTYDSSDDKSRIMCLIQVAQHAVCREDTSRRIKRSQLDLFKSGYATGPLCVGYNRVPVNPVPDGFQKGPWVDKRDDTLTPLIREVFERIARGESLESVAEFAMKAGLPKSRTHSKSKNWCSYNFYDLIRNPIYYGCRRWRFKQVLKKEMTGRSYPVRAEEGYTMHRDEPQMAHVTKDLWDRANAAIASRCTHHNFKKGRDNLRFGVSLKEDETRIGPKLKCWICGGSIRRRGSHVDGVYTCGKVIMKKCWNGVQSTRAIAHQCLKAAILAELRKLPGMFDSIVAKVQEISRDGGELSERLKAVEKMIADNKHKIDNITQAIEDGQCNSKPLVQRMNQLEMEKMSAEEERRHLLEQIGQTKRTFSAEDILSNIGKACKELEQADDRQLQILICSLIEEGYFVPHRRFDNKKFILRCWVRLNLIELLPQEWRDLRSLYQSHDGLKNAMKWICVDLSRNSYPEEGLKDCYEMCNQGKSYLAVSRKWHVSKNTPARWYAFYKKILECGMENTFIPILEPQESSGRYKALKIEHKPKGKSIESLEALITDPDARYLITS